MEIKGAVGAEYDITDNPHEGMAADPPDLLPNPNIMISSEVCNEVAKAIYEYWRSATMESPPWEEVGDDWRTGTLGQARAAIIALFESWPGAQRVKGYFTHDTDYYESAIILPLAQEPSDD